MILALTLPCGLLSCAAGSLTGNCGEALGVAADWLAAGLLELVLRSVCLGDGKMSMRSVRPFFFLALA
jgi:hypothetical protein